MVVGLSSSGVKLSLTLELEIPGSTLGWTRSLVKNFVFLIIIIIFICCSLPILGFSMYTHISQISFLVRNFKYQQHNKRANYAGTAFQGLLRLVFTKNPPQKGSQNAGEVENFKRFFLLFWVRFGSGLFPIVAVILLIFLSSLIQRIAESVIMKKTAILHFLQIATMFISKEISCSPCNAYAHVHDSMTSLMVVLRKSI